mmetsp:Transcript_65181/g.190704  ORF Transcript_65181/g.190704 Transcript_65181/m.190704 type:complete len:226 (-) Transcript_65181:1035-1712(-)
MPRLRAARGGGRCRGEAEGEEPRVVVDLARRLPAMGVQRDRMLPGVRGLGERWPWATELSPTQAEEWRTVLRMWESCVSTFRIARAFFWPMRLLSRSRACTSELRACPHSLLQPRMKSSMPTSSSLSTSNSRKSSRASEVSSWCAEKYACACSFCRYSLNLCQVILPVQSASTSSKMPFIAPRKAWWEFISDWTTRSRSSLLNSQARCTNAPVRTLSTPVSTKRT